MWLPPSAPSPGRRVRFAEALPKTRSRRSCADCQEVAAGHKPKGDVTPGGLRRHPVLALRLTRSSRSSGMLERELGCYPDLHDRPAARGRTALDLRVVHPDAAVRGGRPDGVVLRGPVDAQPENSAVGLKPIQRVPSGFSGLRRAPPAPGGYRRLGHLLLDHEGGRRRLLLRPDPDPRSSPGRCPKTASGGRPTSPPGCASSLDHLDLLARPDPGRSGIPFTRARHSTVVP